MKNGMENSDFHFSERTKLLRNIFKN